MITESAPPTIAAALAAARLRLGPEGTLDAAVLLAHTLGKPQVYLHARPERTLSAGEARLFASLLERRAAGQPVAYLTGHREFWSLDLLVTPATLIPRPDTETLVAAALARLPADEPRRVLDLGTGSGAIALAVARERPLAELTATDLSEPALAVARENARRLNLANVSFAAGRWFEAVPGRRFHMVVSNPPYIPEQDAHLEQGDLRFEPRGALAAGPDGLQDIRAIVAEAPAHLEPGGWLLLEHGYDQGPAVRALLTARGFSAVESCPDLEQRERVTLGRM